MDESWTARFGHLAGFDLETTGVNVESDRVVTASIVNTHPGGGPITTEWLVNPGVDIPEGATAVHGITTEHARDHGMDPATGLGEIVTHLAAAIRDGRVLVGMNVCFDFTLLDRDCRRHGVPTLSDTLGGEIVPVLDVLVIDRMIDRFRNRKGKRTLTDLCVTYGVRIEDAHTSSGDVLATLRLLWAMGRRSTQTGEEILAAYQGRWLKHPDEMVRAWNWLGGLTAEQLHTAQQVAARNQDRSFAQYQRGQVTILRGQAERATDEEVRAELMAEADERARWAASAIGQWPIRPADCSCLTH